MVVVEHIIFWGNHSFWPSNITDIDRDGWYITCRWCQDSYIFPQCCALRENIPWENLTLLAVHRNMIFHGCPGQYLYNDSISFSPLSLKPTHVSLICPCRSNLSTDQSSTRPSTKKTAQQYPQRCGHTKTDHYYNNPYSPSYYNPRCDWHAVSGARNSEGRILTWITNLYI